MATVKKLKRVFNYTKDGKDLELPDPNPLYTPDEVLEHYTAQYPELNNATCSNGKLADDIMYYNFKTTIGTKG